MGVHSVFWGNICSRLLSVYNTETANMRSAEQPNSAHVHDKWWDITAEMWTTPKCVLITSWQISVPSVFGVLWENEKCCIFQPDLQHVLDVTSSMHGFFLFLQDIWPRQSSLGVAAGENRLQVDLQQEVHRGGLSNMAPTWPGTVLPVHKKKKIYIEIWNGREPKINSFSIL